ncbi:hypothetical protein PVK06_003304 [Gossypium arboreum]|uniref:Biogenesis of lysosome-related organelles complex 1 subunit 1 n=1 Tax=Gossypium arboreum TaxID=29729 RepID=A0ABR0R5X2_GOSAR|nr:hypothetical protein PVK06_003304 [Gossypium arboreum]
MSSSKERWDSERIGKGINSMKMITGEVNEEMVKLLKKCVVGTARCFYETMTLKENFKMGGVFEVNINRLGLPQTRGRVLSSSEINKSPAGSGGDLESSLIQIYHHHHHNSLKLRDQAEKAKKDAIKKAGRVSDLLVEAVNGGVQESFINEKRIEAEIRALASTIARFMKQTDQWLAASHAINTSVKEIGDFENWMKSMDFDCKSINAAIRNIYQQ